MCRHAKARYVEEKKKKKLLPPSEGGSFGPEIECDELFGMWAITDGLLRRRCWSEKVTKKECDSIID